MGKLEKCILGIVAAAGIWGIYATSADAAEPTCDTTVKIDAYLRGKGYAEASFGIINPQLAKVTYATLGGERWVDVLIGTDGQACFSFEGVEWWPGAVPPAPVEGERAA